MPFFSILQKDEKVKFFCHIVAIFKYKKILPVQRPNMVEGVYAGAETTVQAEYLTSGMEWNQPTFRKPLKDEFRYLPWIRVKRHKNR